MGLYGVIAGSVAERTRELHATLQELRSTQSELVRSLPALTYLTVGLPRLPPHQIAGIRVGRRARLVDAVFFERVADIPDAQDPDQVTSVWTARYGKPVPPPADSDVALFAQNYIVVTPMRADEHADDLLEELKQRLDRLPSWPPHGRQ